jgi:hypothetical protein
MDRVILGEFGVYDLIRYILPEHRVLWWLWRIDRDGNTLRKHWAVLWLGPKGQALTFTANASPWHFEEPISRMTLIDWCRRWWFRPAVDEANQIVEVACGCYGQARYRIHPPYDEEPPTDRAKLWREIARDRRLARRIEGCRKRLATLGPEGRRAQAQAAHEAVRLKHAQPKCPGWRPGMPWKEPWVPLRVEIMFDSGI